MKAKPEASPATRRRLLLVDDHPFMRAGVAQLIERQPDLTVAGEAGRPSECLAFLATQAADLVVTDLTMPGRSGLDFIKDLQAAYPSLPILVVSMHDEMVYAERALRAGARGYIMKEAGGEALLGAVRQILSGQAYVSPRMAAKLVESATSRQPRGATNPMERLTDREFEVFRLIGEGKTTHAIAAQLNLSTKTVDVHRSHLKEKLGLADSTQLIRHAVNWHAAQGQG